MGTNHNRAEVVAMTQNGKAKEDMKLLGLSMAYENVTFLPWFINV